MPEQATAHVLEQAVPPSSNPSIQSPAAPDWRERYRQRMENARGFASDYESCEPTSRTKNG